MKLVIILALLLFCATAMATDRFVRTDGSSTTNCTGLADAAYDGSGTGEACALSSLADAITAAACGDFIKVKAGQTFDFTSILTLPNKSCTLGNGITITSTAALPSRRVALADSTLMPRLRATGTNTDGIFRTATNAGYWIIDGLELTDNVNAGIQVVNALIDAGTNAGANNITVQRCIIYPKEAVTAPTTRPRPVARAFQFEGTTALFKWNYAYGFSQRDGLGGSANTTVVACFVCNALTITDNYLDGQYVSFFTGGVNENAEFTATLTSPTTTSATFSSTTGIVDDVTWPRFELRGSGTFNSSTSFTRTSGATPTSDDVNHTVWIVHAGGTWRAKITAVSGNNWTLESYGGSLPNVSESCTWTEYMVAKVTNIAGSVITYDGSAATVGQNWLTQTPSSASNAVGWRFNQVVHDIIITRNTIHIDPVLAALEHAATGNSPKGWFEFKSGDGILIDGNYFTGTPSVIAITQHSNEGVTPWTKVKNLTISNNFVNSDYSATFSRQFIVLGLIDPYNSNEPGCCTVISNNLVNNSAIVPMQSSGNTTTLVSHNTFLGQAGGGYGNATIFAEGGPAFGFTFTDNIASFIANGLNCQISPFTQATCFPSGVFDHNVIVDTAAASVTVNSFGTASILPPIKTAFSQVGFVNTVINDYRLSGSSDFKGDGTGGSDPGVAWPALVAALGFDPANPGGSTSVSITGKATISGKVTIQ